MGQNSSVHVAHVVGLHTDAVVVKETRLSILSVKTFHTNTKAGFGYDNSVSLQTDDAGHLGAAVLAHAACVVGLQTNDVRRN